MHKLLPLLLLGSLLGGIPLVSAQSYDLALGVRMGTEWGISGQLRVPVIHKNFAAEGILQSSFLRDETLVTVLGKQHRPILTRRINLFGGAGVHKGWITPEEGQAPIDDPFGITLIGGAEITLARINISYDIRPAINITGGERPFYTQSGVSIRYVLAKRNDIYNKKNERTRNKDRRKRKKAKRKAKRQRDGEKPWWQFWKKEE